ncbi:hypothetical protein [Bacillus infantis]|nr:hypothetical protein [Bacillus infantis]MCP1159373.1 hypothetical protein [Bacillus infantis]
MKKSAEVILAEMEYVQSVIDEKELETQLLKGKLNKLQKELAEVTSV